MKTLLWLTAGVILLLWTGLTAMVAAAAAWLAQAATSGAAVDWVALAAQLDIPAWLIAWFDAGWILAAIDATARLLQASTGLMPWLGSAASWLPTLAWIVWGLGTALLVLLVALAHVAIGRWAPPNPVAPSRAGA